MTTSINWPSELPIPRLGAYAVDPRSPVLESDMGYTVLRRVIQSNAPEDVAVNVLLNRAKEKIFRSFIRYTTQWGTLTFNLPILGNGVLADREVLLIGAQPNYRPASPLRNVASFNVMTLGSMTDGVFELSASDAVNIDANNFGLSATQPAAPIGTVVTINAQASDRIVITKPTIAVDPGLTWDAWSPYGSNGSNGGLTWSNVFFVSNQDDDLLVAYAGAGLQSSIALAQSSVQGDFPMQLSGHTQYKFWCWDSPINDNRGGLSLRVETYSLTS